MATVLGIYTGARMGEIVQLTTSDVRTDNGITYIAIIDEGEKTVKYIRVSEVLIFIMI